MFPFSMKSCGILGINNRNLDYIFPHNPRKLYAVIDDKLETKKIAREIGVATPEPYGIVTFQNEVDRLDKILGDRTSFVVKPTKGSGGDGIIVIKDVTEEGYRKASGKLLRPADIKYHIHNILSGMYSLGGHADRAFLEYAVDFDPVFDEIAYQGVPDIRAIVYRGVPVMAMLRLPTKASDGKANLHRGGVGLGIDLATGKTLVGIQYNRYLETHPETDKPLSGREIPHWKKIITMSAKLGEKTDFGYLGADIVLDRQKGPLLLELNARPGLSIQIANRAGLIPRLKTVERELSGLSGVEQKVEFAMNAFSVFSKKYKNEIGEKQAIL